MAKRSLPVIIAIAVLSLGMLVAACSDDDDDGGEAATGAGQESTTTAEGSTGSSDSGDATGSDGGTGAEPTATEASEDAEDEPTATTEPDAGGGASTVAVASIDFGYQPATITATSGTEVTVEFANQGERPHTFTIDGLVDSGNIAGGESTTVTFTPAQAGELMFYCTVHGAEMMSGTVDVS